MTDAAVPVPAAVRALFSAAIDYAGMFPPAALDPAAAVAQYAAGRRGDSTWMLGRFVVPAARLEDVSSAARGLLPLGTANAPWRLSVIAGADLMGAIRHIERFNARHERTSAAGHAVVDVVEHRVARATDVRSIDEAVPVSIRSVFEVVPGADLEAIVGFVKQVDGIAKIRTGGLSPDAVPSPGAVARFITTCARARVPFKATAGLHHAIRGPHPIGTAPDTSVAVQHGFVNVSMASAVARSRVAAGASPAAQQLVVEAILEETDPKAFSIGQDSAAWRDLRLAATELGGTRAEFFQGFGSCSFDEPVAELRALGLLA